MKTTTFSISFAFVLFIALFTLNACSLGDDDDATSGLPGWMGEEEHLRIVGRVNGEDLDLDFGPGEIEMVCIREYAAPLVEGTVDEFDLSQGFLGEVEVEAVFTIGGEEREFELEFKRHNFSTDSPPTVITIIPRSEVVDPGPDELWLELEWKLPEEEDAYFEESAQEGAVTLELLTGEIGEDGLQIPNNVGDFAVYIEAIFSETESLSVSLTAHCGENDELETP
jgi:hypothetical protein